MATITPISPSNAGVAVTPTATTPAGDEIAYSGGDLVLLFTNGSASAITIDFAPTQTNGIVIGAGSITIPTRSISVAAAASAAFSFKSSNASAYLNANGRIPVTYTTGDASLTVVAMEV